MGLPLPMALDMEPVRANIPHQLGKDAAKLRLDGGIGKLGDVIPGGNVAEHHWEGDRLHFTLKAMGQTIAAKCDVMEDKVAVELDLPPFLAMFAGKIRDKLERSGPKLLT